MLIELTTFLYLTQEEVICWKPSSTFGDFCHYKAVLQSVINTAVLVVLDTNCYKMAFCGFFNKLQILTVLSKNRTRFQLTAHKLPTIENFADTRLPSLTLQTSAVSMALFRKVGCLVNKLPTLVFLIGSFSSTSQQKSKCVLGLRLCDKALKKS